LTGSHLKSVPLADCARRSLLESRTTLENAVC
jgi:hypothetical protein